MGGAPTEPEFARAQLVGECLTGYDSPDDGVDSDSVTGDYKLTDANAVFVAPPTDGGSDSQAGTRASPKATLGSAVTLARSAHKAIALARGTYAAADLSGVFVYGGYDPSDWSRNIVTQTSRIEVVAPLMIGGDVNTETSGGIDGITVTGQSAGALVRDMTNTFPHLEPQDSAFGSTVVASVLDCSNCPGAVVDLNLPGVRVLNSTIRGGHAGIHSAAEGGLGKHTQLQVCGNDVIGSGTYAKAIDVGLDANGPVTVDWNDVTLANDSSVGIEVGGADMNQTLFATFNATIAHNLIIGRGTIGIANGAGAEIALNVVSLATANSVGIAADAGGVTAPVPLSFVGNTVSAGGVAISIANLETNEPNDDFIPRFIGNSLRGTEAIHFGLDDMSTIILINNIFDASHSALTFDCDLALPAVQLRNNDIIGHPNLIVVRPPWGEPEIDLTSIAGVNACAWDGCSMASGNISTPPLYSPQGSLHVLASSPCVNAGIDPTSFAGAQRNFLGSDIDGDPRPSGSAWDIGSDEIP